MEHSEKEDIDPNITVPDDDSLNRKSSNFTLNKNEQKMSGAPVSKIYNVSSTQSTEFLALENPEQTLESIVDPGFKRQLDEWQILHETIDKIRRLAIHHPSTIQGSITPLLGIVSQASQNLRSSVSKNGMRCLLDLVSSCSSSLTRPQTTSIINDTLPTLGSEKKFMKSGAEEVLRVVGENGNPIFVIISCLSHTASKQNHISSRSHSLIQEAVEKIITPDLLPEKLAKRIVRVCERGMRSRSRDAQVSCVGILNHLSFLLGEEGMWTLAIKELSESETSSLRYEMGRRQGRQQLSSSRPSSRSSTTNMSSKRSSSSSSSDPKPWQKKKRVRSSNPPTRSLR